ncbi:MAG TPA: CRISPR-associated endonuclease Cas2 [Chitinophagales bacterium]|nr:CRISPR-associated endonuclease Cas2 [Chitinophagales bacterium]
MSTQKLYIICYDIASNKKRSKVAEKLEACGKRINYSVFECMLTDSKLKQLKTYMELQTSKKSDFVKIYHLCLSCFAKSTAIGNETHIQHNHSIFIE